MGRRIFLESPLNEQEDQHLQCFLFRGIRGIGVRKESSDVCVQRPRFLLTQISIPIAVVLLCPFKISSTAVAVYLHRPMQYICSEKPMRCLDKVTALHPFTHRLVFANAPRYVFFQHTAHRSPLIAHNSLLSPPHNNVPSAACPAASTLICVVRALLYNVMCASPFSSSRRLGFQYSVRR